MCEFEARLIAWIDGELDSSATREIESHIETCTVCSAKTAEYREVSRAFAAYFELPSEPVKSPKAARWAAVASLSAAAAAAAAAILLFPLRPIPEIPRPHEPLAAPPAIAFVKRPSISAPTSGVVQSRRLHASSIASAKSAPIETQPTIEIAIPADAMFAPGAFPAGLAFAADLSIRGDGSPETLRVRPATYLK